MVHPGLGYVELHCHSAYSFLDGASLPAELAERAAELGYGALALTDHNSLSGSMELAQAAQGLGLRALHGAEVDLDDGRHVTLLVREARGWANLCHLLTGRMPTPACPSRGAARCPRRWLSRRCSTMRRAWSA